MFDKCQMWEGAICGVPVSWLLGLFSVIAIYFVVKKLKFIRQRWMLDARFKKGR